MQGTIQFLLHTFSPPAPGGGWAKVLRVLEVQEVLVGVVVGHNVGQEGVHDVDSDVPGVCVGQQDLRVLEVLVVCQDVREGGSRALWRTAPS